MATLNCSLRQMSCCAATEPPDNYRWKSRRKSQSQLQCLQTNRWDSPTDLISVLEFRVIDRVRLSRTYAVYSLGQSHLDCETHCDCLAVVTQFRSASRSACLSRLSPLRLWTDSLPWLSLRFYRLTLIRPFGLDFQLASPFISAIGLSNLGFRSPFRFSSL